MLEVVGNFEAVARRTVEANVRQHHEGHEDRKGRVHCEVPQTQRDGHGRGVREVVQGSSRSGAAQEAQHREVGEEAEQQAPDEVSGGGKGEPGEVFEAQQVAVSAGPSRSRSFEGAGPCGVQAARGTHDGAGDGGLRVVEDGAVSDGEAGGVFVQEAPRAAEGEGLVGGGDQVRDGEGGAPLSGNVGAPCGEQGVARDQAAVALVQKGDVPEAVPGRGDDPQRAHTVAVVQQAVGANGVQVVRQDFPGGHAQFGMGQGVRASSLYRHFPDRAALEAALADGAAGQLHAALRDASAGATGRDALFRAGDAYLAFARAHPELYALIHAPRPPTKAGAGPGKDLWNFVLSLVAGVTGEPDDTAGAVALWAFLHGFVALERSGLMGLSGPRGGFQRGLRALAAQKNAPT